MTKTAPSGTFATETVLTVNMQDDPTFYAIAFVRTTWDGEERYHLRVVSLGSSDFAEHEHEEVERFARHLHREAEAQACISRPVLVRVFDRTIFIRE